MEKFSFTKVSSYRSSQLIPHCKNIFFIITLSHCTLLNIAMSSLVFLTIQSTDFILFMKGLSSFEHKYRTIILRKSVMMSNMMEIWTKPLEYVFLDSFSFIPNISKDWIAIVVVLLYKLILNVLTFSIVKIWNKNFHNR